MARLRLKVILCTYEGPQGSARTTPLALKQALTELLQPSHTPELNKMTKIREANAPGSAALEQCAQGLSSAAQITRRRAAVSIAERVASRGRGASGRRGAEIACFL